MTNTEKHHESNWAWGPITVAPSIVISALAAMMHDPRLLLPVAWLILILGVGRMCKSIPYKRAARWLVLLAACVFGCGLLALSNSLTLPVSVRGELRADFTAFNDPHYAPGTVIAGVNWSDKYSDIRVLLFAKKAPVYDIDATIIFDASTAAYGRLTDVPLTLTRFDSPIRGPIELTVLDSDAKPRKFRAGPVDQDYLFTNCYRIHSDRLLVGFPISLIFAGQEMTGKISAAHYMEIDGTLKPSDHDSTPLKIHQQFGSRPPDLKPFTISRGRTPIKR